MTHILISCLQARSRNYEREKERKKTGLCSAAVPGLHQLPALVGLRSLWSPGRAGSHRPLLRPLPLPACPLQTGQSDRRFMRLGGGAAGVWETEAKQSWSQVGGQKLSSGLSASSPPSLQHPFSDGISWVQVSAEMR